MAVAQHFACEPAERRGDTAGVFLPPGALVVTPGAAPRTTGGTGTPRPVVAAPGLSFSRQRSGERNAAVYIVPAVWLRLGYAARGPFCILTEGIRQLIRVLLVDDHAVVRQGVERLLESGADMVVVGQAADADEAVTVVAAVEADVCMLDLGIPGGGPDLVVQLRELRPRLRILVFTMQRPEQVALKVLSLGAAGFLGKSCPPGEIPIAVRAVAAGRRYVSEQVAALLADRIVGGGPDEPHQRLSGRELEVFNRLARGQGPSEIAEALGVSVKSVSTYRSRVLSKMGVERNADLTRYALERGLLD